MVLVTKGHGRLERREGRVSSELARYSRFPGLGQVGEIRKRVVHCKTGEVEHTTRYFITSLSGMEADPRQLLDYYRTHWGIENKLFHVKDDSFRGFQPQSRWSIRQAFRAQA